MEEGTSDSETDRIRNICILAHVDHGKTTLADHLIAAAGGGVVHPKLAGRVRFMDYLDEEQRRAITMKSSSILLRYERHAVNLIDSPGHIDFCSEVSTAARLSDGALLLVDAVEGVHIQTHAVLRQCWIERLTPCLVLNKLDRLITELKLTPSEAYTRLSRIVHEVNGIVSAYKSEKYLSDVDSLLAGASTSELGASVNALQRALWGAKFYNPKTKMIVGKKGVGANKKPMFVQFVLEPLWQVYQGALDGDKGLVEKVVRSFSLSVPPRELQNKDVKVVLQAVMSRWLPLSDAVLGMVVRCLPDPVVAQAYRISRLVPKREVEVAEDERAVVEEVEMADSDECFLAFARIFSGVLYAGQRVFVLSPLYDPLKGESMQKHIQEAELKSLYLMMGQGLKVVTSAKAGNIVAIAGLGQHILKSATLSSTRNCWPFSSMAFQVAPTLRVAIEPSDPADVGALLKGLRLLNRADPFVEVTVSARGEHVLAAAGEVHLERCVKDLKERFARVSLEVSPPLVSYKESIEGDVSNVLENLKVLSRRSDYVEKSTPNGSILENDNPTEVLKKRILDAVEGDILSRNENDKDHAEKCKLKWQKILRRIWALGPRQIGPNILFTPDIKAESTDNSVLIRDAEHLESSVISGFQLATSAGPLCDEPMWGLAFVIEARITPFSGQHDESETHQQSEQYGLFAGQVIATVKDACRAAVLQNKPRLVEAMYFCELNTPTEYLGPMYAVLSRRRARVLKEEMQEGSPFFTVHAYVPVSESFGFADELRRWTSGAASALLVLSHWEALPEDPFFVPKTEEEIEEFGDGSSVLPNTARKLINAVRRHKGLPVEEKVVQHGTKQRTLARKV
uniref:Elongation factor-like 1 n=1 Tax=Cajanus cajan TaxID=3821 RepID=A0A151RDL0_CAJCA|nr:Elongation factor 2 [Cajanus cajan]